MNEESIITKFEINSCIGKGAFSQVYRGTHIPTGVDVAIKIIDFEKLECDDRVGTIREVATLLQLDHPNIVALYNYTFFEDKLYLFLEYLSSCTLLDKVNHSRGLTEERARRYFSDILKALFYLHNIRGIVHRDLKLQNIMVTPDDHVKLIDFGFCNSTNKTNIFHTFVGTPGFTAPEVIQSTCGYNEECDIFSLGICLYSMIAGKRPFDTQNKNKELLVEQIENLEFIGNFSNEAKDLIRKMIIADPEKRISLEQVILSDWMQSEFRPALSMKSPIDLRRFTNKDSLQMMCSRKNLLKPNLSAISALAKFGYAPEKVMGDLRRGRNTDGTAAYVMMTRTLSPEELDESQSKKGIMKKSSKPISNSPSISSTTMATTMTTMTTTSTGKKVVVSAAGAPAITIPNSKAGRGQQKTPHFMKSEATVKQKLARSVPKTYRSRFMLI